MKTKIIILTLITSFWAIAQYGQQNTSGYTEREKLQQTIEQNRKEINNSSIPPNPKNNQQTPKFNIEDNGVRYEITNHLFGYSIISEKDQSLSGIKITGFLNIAYYNVKIKDNNKSKGRLIFGIESPVVDFKRSSIYAGGGMTIGDVTGIYLNTGIDYHLSSWFKLQGGLNYTTGSGVGPIFSAGFTW